MIVKGTKKEVKIDIADVEVSKEEIFQKIWEGCLLERPAKARFIRDGYWYVEYFFDYHKREEVDTKDRQATKEEIDIDNAIKLLRKNLK